MNKILQRIVGLIAICSVLAGCTGGMALDGCIRKGGRQKANKPGRLWRGHTRFRRWQIVAQPAAMAFARNARLTVIVVGMIVLADSKCFVCVVMRTGIDARTICLITAMRLMQAAPK